MKYDEVTIYDALTIYDAHMLIGIAVCSCLSSPLVDDLKPFYPIALERLFFVLAPRDFMRAYVYLKNPKRLSRTAWVEELRKQLRFRIGGPFRIVPKAPDKQLSPKNIYKAYMLIADAMCVTAWPDVTAEDLFRLVSPLDYLDAYFFLDADSAGDEVNWIESFAATLTKRICARSLPEEK